MESTHKRSILSFSTIAIFCLLVLVVNILSDALLSRFSIDLTEEGLFSLSDGSKRIISSVKKPITLRFYLSKTEGSKFPAIKMYGNRVRDLLKEYERKSAGNIKLEIYDPLPDTEEEEWAQKYGLTPVPLPTGGQLYFGMVATSSLGEEEVLPMFNLQRQEFLEYDISKIIYSLQLKDKPLVGIISPLEVKPATPAQSPHNFNQPQTHPWVFVSQLARFADVVELGTDVEKISENVSVLVVLHPKKLPEKTVYAIDQFVVGGGNAFIAVDPYASVDQPENANPNNPMAALQHNSTSNLPKLFSAWGVESSAGRVVGDLSLAANVSNGRLNAPIRFPVWLSLGAKSASGEDVVNRESIVTSELDNIVIPWSGSLKIVKKEGLDSEVLFKTSSEAMLYKAEEMKFSAQNPQALIKKFVRGSESLNLAVKLSGKFKSAFEKKPGAPELGVEGNVSVPDGHMEEGEKDSTVIILADVDMLADRFSAVAQNILGTRLVSLLNDNLIFAANAIENLVGSNDLISLRSRGRFSRPFTTVERIEAKAHEKWQAEEGRLKAKLAAANQRLTQLQSGTGVKEGKAVFTTALMEEIKEFREERQLTQKNLRDVRRRLREDKERLGIILFVLNTFLVPFLLIVGSLIYYTRRSDRKLARENNDQE